MMRAPLCAFLFACCTTCAILDVAPAYAQSEDASAEFRRCAVLFGTERFAEAAECFAHAYELGHDPSMLYNLGRARERAGQAEGAIEAYRAYLAASPEAAERAEVEASLATLEAARPSAPPVETTPSAPIATPDPPTATTPTTQVEGPDLLGPALIGGLGLAGLGVAIGLSIQAGATHAAAVTEPVQLRALALDRDANGLALGANIAWIAGGVLSAVAFTWALVELVESSSVDDTPAPRASIAIGPSSIQLHLEL